jgi:DNA-binding MarR family transcriptional regulator
MYSSVRRLEVDGDIAWYWGDESQGGRRKYFRMTEKGKATYDRNQSNWEYAKRVLDNLLERKGVVMHEQLTNYVDGVFAPYDGVKSVTELKADLLSDLQERFRELKAEGKDDETAFAMTIESIGDIEQTVREVANL